MNGRRALAELLSELGDLALLAGPTAAGAAGSLPVRPSSLWVSLPIDLRLVPTDAGVQVVGDVPLFRTRTDFDPDPARLEIGWHAVTLARQEAS